jgi:hypothetical protein
MKKGLAIGAAVVGVLIGIALLLSEKAPTTFSGEVESYSVENPSSLAVSILVTNEGDVASNWECLVGAHDPSRSYNGFELLTSFESLGAGKTMRYDGSLSISNEGAAFVDEVTVRDCEANEPAAWPR